ncbi:O-antigen ligase family protein [Desulfoferrobacter suflitae]|uniref:O-antigen ligase family protein n=1 Tax=Desulfoferrobacter suflitae TaxID=2865782 RepID=UPI002164E962|nr:O-antigen ligase family protein [Desulfoferrobacter suflitae]MCK8603936.1 O-antigen ligase family protein [Desulfoferrobacter suflitae]
MSKTFGLLHSALLLLIVAGIWILIVHPWMAIGLLVMVPIVKVPAVNYVPFFGAVDLTVFANLLAASAAFLAYARRPSKTMAPQIPYPMLASLGVVVFVSLLGLLWTTAPQYGQQKLIRFVGIGLPYLLLPSFFVYTKGDAVRLLFLVIAISVVIALGLIALPNSHLAGVRYGFYYDRGTFLGSDPNTPATLIVAGLLVLLTGVLTGSTPNILKYTVFLIFPIGLGGILISGSRANLLGLCTFLPFAPFIVGRQGRGKLKFVSLVATSIIFLTAFLVPIMNQEIPVERWLDFSEQIKQGDLSNTRSQAWAFCLTNAWDHLILLGHGPGSYAMDFLHKDQPLWPHSILLEALYEEGLIGIMAVLYFFIVCLRTTLRGLHACQSREDVFLVVGVSALVWSMTVPALTHWDFNGSRFLYLFAGLLHSTVYLVTSNIDEVEAVSGAVVTRAELTKPDSA